LRDDKDEEYMVVALLHDIGETLGPFNHGEVIAAILRPFICRDNYFMLAHHSLFQTYFLPPTSGWTPTRGTGSRGTRLTSGRSSSAPSTTKCPSTSATPTSRCPPLSRWCGGCSPRPGCPPSDAGGPGASPGCRELNGG